MIYFLLSDLPKIHSFYKYSLESFIDVINRAIDQITEGMDNKQKMYDVDENGNAIIPEVKKKKKNKKKGEMIEGQPEDAKEETPGEETKPAV